MKMPLPAPKTSASRAMLFFMDSLPRRLLHRPQFKVFNAVVMLNPILVVHLLVALKEAA